MRHHGAGLRRILKDRERADAIVRDYTAAELSSRELAILDYAVKLTTRPDRMERSDVERLRREGLDDGEVLDVCQVVAYYNYVNRLVDGLGVELERFWPEMRGRSTPD